ncbi:sugar phosphate isomerase/epimerase family protein [Cohnella silvisoli]|uniref:Sugar phosphate isomerase/epimerase family protein n=1 Tax=Cohnella silvisoli TaxID=2873699 RepID=A0ABV1KX01_9BACL|nr:sugar phosphate isomerase/epimerase family protein [Cohnella silvisoli]MCD9023710.1 sugar phosphate isomerase/epimerase [Cohnella silvisoli]
MNPKISFGSWAFTFGPFSNDPWSFSRVLKYVSEAGYQGIEINGFAPHPTPESHPTALHRKELMKEIESYGLGVSGYAPDFTAVPPALAEQSDYLKLMESYMVFCGDLGISTLRVDTVSAPELLDEREYEERFDRLVSTWRASAQMAAAVGIKIVWEFEPGFWLNKPSEVKRLMDSVDHPAFKVLFDTSHAYMSGVIGARHIGEREILPGGIVEYAKLLERHIGHFHLIDSDGTLHDDETSTHAAFGAGYVDFNAFLTELKPVVSKLDWWCVDFCFNAETEEWGKAAVPYIRERIKEVG